MAPDPYAWSLDADGIVIAGGLLGLYAVGVRHHPAPRWRVVCFTLGCLLILVTHVTPLAALSNNYLLSAHLLQNVALAEWAPALCVVGLPPALASRLVWFPGARLLTHPAVTLPLWIGTYVVWHLPWAYDAALRHQSSLLHLEHACYFAAGVLFWWPVFQQRPHALSPGWKTIYLFAAFVVSAPLGLLLSLLPTPIYDFYETAPRLWGLSPLADQQIAGVTMSVEEAVVFFCLCAWFFARFLHEEERRDSFRTPVRGPTSSSS
jgi:cytochrome c oxidase assembly factor CtaG